MEHNASRDGQLPEQVSDLLGGFGYLQRQSAGAGPVGDDRRHAERRARSVSHVHDGIVLIGCLREHPFGRRV